MKVVKLLVLLFLGTLVVSCNKDTDDEIFKGEVLVTLKAKGATSFVEGEAASISYDVVLSKSFDKDIKLFFDLENLSEYPNLVSFPESVVIPKNKTLGSFTIKGIEKPDIDNVLTENKTFKILLSKYEGITNEMRLDNVYNVTVQKEEGFEVLTEVQKELLKTYKDQGIDLTNWIGKISVSVKVVTAAGGGFAPFDVSETLEYSGTTYITLSENATADKPILKMVQNAFGLNEYLQWVFRNETIENTDYWYNPNDENVNPAGKAVLKALGDDKVNKWINKEYSFNVVVDELEVKADGTIEFVRENGAFDTYTDFLTPESERERNLSAVDFQYEFPLWDELAELTKSNADLKDHIAQGGSIHPNNYIGYSTILTDDWGEGNWVEPKASFSATKMRFYFTSDHTNSGDYDKIEVIFTANKLFF